MGGAKPITLRTLAIAFHQIRPKRNVLYLADFILSLVPIAST